MHGLRNECLRSIVLILVLTLPALAKESITVPFQLIDGWAIVLQGQIADRPVKILIDTGAVPSAISLRLVNQLGITGTFKEVSVFNQTLNAEKVRVARVRIGPLSVDNLDMMAINLATIERALGTQIDAVIGLDFLSKRNFSLDYRDKILIFADPPPDPQAIAFKVRYEAGGTYTIMPLEIDGQKLQMLLDTGTKDLILFEQRLPHSLKISRGKTESNLNFGGEGRLTEVELRSARLGAISRRKQKAYVWSVNKDQLRDFDGLLGPTALGATSISFDFDRCLVSFKTAKEL